jgi:hypothetical protein
MEFQIIATQIAMRTPLSSRTPYVSTLDRVIFDKMLHEKTHRSVNFGGTAIGSSGHSKLTVKV